MHSDQKKIIINFTPTGMIPTKEITPYVPITPDEIVEDVLECAKLGANITHIHACDEFGNRTYRKDYFEKIISGIREHSDIVISVTCSGRNYSELEKRAEVLNLSSKFKPEMASLTLSSLNFNRIASVNSPDVIKSLASRMLAQGIKAELEVFDLGMVNYAKYLISKGFLNPPFYFNIILGNIACAQARPLHLGLILEELPNNSVVTVGGIGNFQHSMNIMGILFADGARVGLEDNIYFDIERKKLATNWEMVKRITNQIDALGYKIASPGDVREFLELPSYW